VLLFSLGVIFLFLFTIFLGKVEAKELSRLPLLKRMYRTRANKVPPPDANNAPPSRP
jgi:hypothetical protein